MAHQNRFGSDRAMTALLGLFTLVALTVTAPVLACPVSNPSDTGACGPTFTVTGMGDLAGWNQPEYYSTIQLADIDGDGVNEMLARTPAGIVAYEFDFADSGQWLLIARTTATAPFFSDELGWADPSHYETIQTAHLLAGSSAAQVLGLGPNGIEMYAFTPGTTPFTGSWQAQTNVNAQGIFAGTAFSTDDKYETIQFGDIDGDGIDEMIGRDANGIQTYRFDNANGIFVKIGSNGADMVDAGAAWDQPQQYKTIRLVDLDADGSAELIGRSNSGIKVWRWDGDSGSWGSVSMSTTILTDNIYNSASHYTTLQFANVTDDNDPSIAGRPELLIRSSLGMDAYLWVADTFFLTTTDTRFSDANGWTDVTNYESIQAADVDGDGFAEILARGDLEIVVDGFDQQSLTWSSSSIDSGSRLLLADDPWAQGAEYYTTLQSADVDGQPGTELIARGPYGLRTWRFDTALPGWRRYADYGFGYGVGATIDAGGVVYTTINDYLDLPTPGNDIRSRYADTNLSTLAGELATFQSCLSQSLLQNTTPTLTCALLGAVEPMDDRGVVKADWDIMANQLIAEIGSAAQATRFFEDQSSVLGQLFSNQNSEFPALSEDIKIDDFTPKTKTGFNQADLWEEITGSVGAAFGVIPGGGEASSAFYLASSVIGIVSLFDTTNPSQSKFTQTYDQMADQIAIAQQQIEDAVVGHHTYVGRDYGLLTAAARQQLHAPLDAEAYLSGGRYAFTKWIYQSYMPLNDWALWENTLCQDISVIQLNIKCNIPGVEDDPIAEYLQYVNIFDFTDADGNNAPITAFTGILKPNTINDEKPCFGDITSNLSPGPEVCTWNEIDPDDVTALWDPITEECTYNASGSNGNAWRYGCTLGVDDEIFENTGGWSWKTLSATIDVDTNGSVRKNSTTSTSPPDDTLKMSFRDSARSPKVRALDFFDLSNPNTTLVVERLLDEMGGAGELVRRSEALRGTPIELHLNEQLSRFPERNDRRGHSRRSFAVFETPTGQEPNLRVSISIHKYRNGDRKFGIEVRGRELDVLKPRLCADGESDGITQLFTRIRIHDGSDTPSFTIAHKTDWECRSQQGEFSEMRMLAN